MISPSKQPVVVGLLLMAVAGVLGGCQLAAFVLPRERTFDVTAQYRGLDGRSVAVLVAADEYTLYRFPKAPAYTCKVISASLQASVPDVTMMNPKQIVQYQSEHPHWVTYRYSRILRDLGVDRLVIVDLADYQTHEPGNSHIWRGVISGTVSVIEADGPDPDDVGASFDVAARYPEEGEVGLLDQDDETIQLGMLQVFARDVARLFHDHQVTL